MRGGDGVVLVCARAPRDRSPRIPEELVGPLRRPALEHAELGEHRILYRLPERGVDKILWKKEILPRREGKIVLAPARDLGLRVSGPRRDRLEVVVVLRVARGVVEADGRVCARIRIILLVLRILESRRRIRLAPLVCALCAREEVLRFRRLPALLEDSRRLRERTRALERHLAVLRPGVVASVVELDGLEEAGIA